MFLFENPAFYSGSTFMEFLSAYIFWWDTFLTIVYHHDVRFCDFQESSYWFIDFEYAIHEDASRWSQPKSILCKKFLFSVWHIEYPLMLSGSINFSDIDYGWRVMAMNEQRPGIKFSYATKATRAIWTKADDTSTTYEWSPQRNYKYYRWFYTVSSYHSTVNVLKSPF